MRQKCYKRASLRVDNISLGIVKGPQKPQKFEPRSFRYKLMMFNSAEPN